ncbi:MAG: extracellular solute-binding protein [Saccharofermentanales bacterium]
MKKPGKIISAMIVMGAIAMMMANASVIRTFGADESAGFHSAEPLNAYRSNNFVSYEKLYDELGYASVPIILSADQAVLSPEGTAGEPFGNETVILMEPDGYIEFAVEISESAKYEIELTYMTDGSNPLAAVNIMVDKKLPYKEISQYKLCAVYRDGPKRYSESGDQLISEQYPVQRFQSRRLINLTGLTSANLHLVLEKGSHTIRLTALENGFRFRTLGLTSPQVIPKDENTFADQNNIPINYYDGQIIRIEAEETLEKSDTMLYPLYDRSNPSATPYDPNSITRSTIGRGNWSDYGMWLSYDVDVPESSFYQMSFKYRQDDSVGLPVYRSLYVNDLIQSEPFADIPFEPSFSWRWHTVSGADGSPGWVRLEKGSNTIRIEVSQGEYADILSKISKAANELNRIYIRIVMVTGRNPDIYRDYELEKEIESLLDSFSDFSKILSDAASDLDIKNKGTSPQSEELQSMVRRLNSFVSDPRSIPGRLADFLSGISALKNLVSEMLRQPLELDSIVLHGRDTSLPQANSSFLEQITHEWRIFVNSFRNDYQELGSNDKETIKVWVNMGRDQIQVIKDLVNDSFTQKYDYNVDLTIVQTGFIEAALAGMNPDAALGIARGQPVNLAMRNALRSFDEYSGFAEMKERFTDTAIVPYMYNGKTYAIPCSQHFYVLFYRKDILDELGINVPETWEELLNIIPKIQRSHMTIGLPYNIISAAAAVDNGMGAKDLYATLLLQNGGQLYNDSLTSTKLDGYEAVSAFERWCSFYTKYGFDLILDFYTRFVSGEMPIGITSFEMYQVLSIAGKQIQGEWDIALIPGTLKPGGSIDRSEAGAGTAAVIFGKTKNPDASYEFIDWWTSDEIQTRFVGMVEQTLGIGGRYSTANLAAFNTLGWSSEQLKILNEQRRAVIELPEIPGSYYVSRSIDNAFRNVVYSNGNARQSLERENAAINREITRKLNELKKR